MQGRVRAVGARCRSMQPAVRRLQFEIVRQRRLRLPTTAAILHRRISARLTVASRSVSASRRLCPVTLAGGHLEDRAGQVKRRSIEPRYRRTRIAPDRQAAVRPQQQRHGDGELGLTNLLVLTSSRGRPGVPGPAACTRSPRRRGREASVESEGPKDFAVLRLSTNSNLADRMTGRSPGFSPLRTRPA